MPALSLPTFPSTPALLPDFLQERFGRIKHIFSDTDATMVTHGSALCDSAGNPSVALPQALVALQRMGIDVIPCTGRSRAMIREVIRMLGLPGWIGEMGGILCLHEGTTSDWQYFTADMTFDPRCGKTPHEIILETGIVERMQKRWFDSLELYNDNGIGYQYREVSVAFRGAVMEDEVRQMMDETGLPLYLADNGMVTRITGDTILPTIAGERLEDVHTYHITPRGLDKGSAVARYIELMGWDPEECLACGDSPADCEMAKQVGTFVLMRNGIHNPKSQAVLANATNAFVSARPSTDGWCDMAHLLTALHS
ncbi:HAD family hydrolase [uncultured Olegusella sp.]|uniref:HAD family hydrolase n=1 Tax=uncultured Olegusella sp. TaxID=1979846 RepID=UPI00261EA040|nr:HAD family hydrolase [uncultured Olegusella sp.]